MDRLWAVHVTSSLVCILQAPVLTQRGREGGGRNRKREAMPSYVHHFDEYQKCYWVGDAVPGCASISSALTYAVIVPWTVLQHSNYSL